MKFSNPKNENWWEFIPETNNKYIISRDGRVVSLDYNGENILKELSQWIHAKYLAVKITKNGKNKICHVHRLMAETFLPNPDNLPEVNHKSGNKTENTITNLEWCTRSQNVQHAYNNGLKVAKSGSEHPKSMPIKMFDLNMNYIRDFVSCSECCEYLKTLGYKKVQPSYISRVVLGQRKRYGNYTFRKI